MWGKKSQPQQPCIQKSRILFRNHCKILKQPVLPRKLSSFGLEDGSTTFPPLYTAQRKLEFYFSLHVRNSLVSPNDILLQVFFKEVPCVQDLQWRVLLKKQILKTSGTVSEPVCPGVLIRLSTQDYYPTSLDQGD